jgi:hypothetical protein
MASICSPARRGPHMPLSPLCLGAPDLPDPRAIRWVDIDIPQCSRPMEVAFRPGLWTQSLGRHAKSTQGLFSKGSPLGLPESLGGCSCAVSACAGRSGRPSPDRRCGCTTVIAGCAGATGSPFAVLAWVGRDDVRWIAQAPAIRRSSPLAERGFCRQCGTPLLLRYDNRDEVALTVGSLDDAAAWAPTSHCGIEGRLPRADCGSGLRGSGTKETF